MLSLVNQLKCAILYLFGVFCWEIKCKYRTSVWKVTKWLQKKIRLDVRWSYLENVLSNWKLILSDFSKLGALFGVKVVLKLKHKHVHDAWCEFRTFLVSLVMSVIFAFGYFLRTLSLSSVKAFLCLVKVILLIF